MWELDIDFSLEGGMIVTFQCFMAQSGVEFLVKCTIFLISSVRFLPNMSTKNKTALEGF